MGISTHVLDTALGRPAAGVPVTLERWDGGGWSRLAQATTDEDGRVRPLLTELPAEGRYRVSFEVAGYFERHQTDAFFPAVQIEFKVRAVSEHYHVPLLLSPFGYSTYRGS